MQRRSFLQMAVAGITALTIGVLPQRRSLAVYLVSDSEDTHIIAWSEADAIEVMKEEFGVDDDDLESVASITKVGSQELIQIRFDCGLDYVRPDHETGSINVYGDETDMIEVEKTASYLESWLERLKADKQLIFTVAKWSNKAADFILGGELEQAVEVLDQRKLLQEV